jgi:signal transduction histidine kinase
VTVRLTYDGTLLHAEVADDGRGFDTSTTPRRGLMALADRVAALSGELKVHSEVGKGTRLWVQVPARTAENERG